MYKIRQVNSSKNREVTLMKTWFDFSSLSFSVSRIFSSISLKYTKLFISYKNIKFPYHWIIHIKFPKLPKITSLTRMFLKFFKRFLYHVRSSQVTYIYNVTFKATRKLFYLHLFMPTLLLPANQGSTRNIHRNVVAFFNPEWHKKKERYVLA